MKYEVEEQIILTALDQKIFNKADFERLKRQIAGGFKIPPPPTSYLNQAYHKLIKQKKIKHNKYLEALLVRRPVRTLSGITPITVLTKPFPCPGACVYCPSEVTMPKSYVSNEPAAMRALYLRFDPFSQVTRRLTALYENGHPVDKLELIVKGGTWSAYPLLYQRRFIKRCFDAANSFNAKKKTAASLRRAQKINEKAKSRIIGINLETRPDFINPKEVERLRNLGCTRIELGVQTLDEKILELVRRGHYTGWVSYATHILKDAGLKVDYHVMPGLPGSTPEKDVQTFKQLFDDTRYRPDMIKLYPCVLLPNTELYEWWKKGKYKPRSDKSLVQTFIKMKSIVPRYVRISRLVRDFPSPSIVGGSKTSNLREYIKNEMQKLGKKCQCLRCREIGHNPDFNASRVVPQLFIDEYKASGGTEYFLSFEDKDREVVFGFLRLRFPSATNFEIIKELPELKDCAIIRELHVYGQQLALGKTAKQATQHKGLGKKLMAKAEEIARKNNYKKMAVISGVGVREYYRTLGYSLKKSYMIKDL